MDRERGHPVLHRVLGLLPAELAAHAALLKHWHEHYGPAGLQVIGVHCPGFPPSQDVKAVRAAVARLQIPYPVIIDPEFEVWRDYGNAGWPARYLWDARGMLFEYHYGEGAYDETERAIQELLGVGGELLAPRCAPRTRRARRSRPRPRISPAPTAGPTRPAACGRCSRATARSTSTGARSPSTTPAPTCSSSTPTHREDVLELRIGAGVTCHATCFSPGLSVESPVGAA